MQIVKDQVCLRNSSLYDLAGICGTASYLYSESIIEQCWQAYQQAFEANDQKHMICYAVKANSNLTILKILKQLGAGFDVVSIGELQRVITIGGNPNKIIFSGVGKTDKEIIEALQYNIYCFNVESLPEIDRINQFCSFFFLFHTKKKHYFYFI